MNKLWVKITVALFVVAIAVTTVLVCQSLWDSPSSEAGTITVEIVPDGKATQSYTLSFDVGDTLCGVLEKNFTVEYDQSQMQYGRVLLGIGDLHTDFEHTYLAVYVNGEYSNYGISYLVLADGMTFSFRETKVNGFGG